MPLPTEIVERINVIFEILNASIFKPDEFNQQLDDLLPEQKLELFTEYRVFSGETIIAYSCFKQFYQKPGLLSHVFKNLPVSSYFELLGRLNIFREKINCLETRIETLVTNAAPQDIIALFNHMPFPAVMQLLALQTTTEETIETVLNKRSINIMQTRNQIQLDAQILTAVGENISFTFPMLPLEIQQQILDTRDSSGNTLRSLLEAGVYLPGLGTLHRSICAQKGPHKLTENVGTAPRLGMWRTQPVCDSNDGDSLDQHCQYH